MCLAQIRYWRKNKFWSPTLYRKITIGCERGHFVLPVEKHCSPVCWICGGKLQLASSAFEHVFFRGDCPLQEKVEGSSQTQGI